MRRGGLDLGSEQERDSEREREIKKGSKSRSEGGRVISLEREEEEVGDVGSLVSISSP